MRPRRSIAILVFAGIVLQALASGHNATAALGAYLQRAALISDLQIICLGHASAGNASSEALPWIPVHSDPKEFCQLCAGLGGVPLPPSTAARLVPERLSAAIQHGVHRETAPATPHRPLPPVRGPPSFG